MDYTRAPLLFRVRKAARYTRLYGLRRTAVKVRGQYHMRPSDTDPVRLRSPSRPDAHVGLIGCGNFAYTTIAYFLAQNFGGVVRGAMDADPSRAASLARRYRAHYATDDAERVLTDPQIDLVYIASNHASHAEYAIAALEHGKHVHIEKPHVVSEDQLTRLCTAMEGSRGEVRLGFNRPDSKLGRETRRLLEAQKGPIVFNWFVAGHEIPADHWYYREEEGGRVLGNLCHWTDFVLQMVPAERRFPVQIRPARAAESDANIAVGYVFGDGSIAAITFSAKGHAFEGVRERMAAHRGELLLSLADFKELRADVGPDVSRTRLRLRDHGHEDAIVRSYGLSDRSPRRTEGSPAAYVWQTGQLFLKTRDALERDEPILLEAR